MTISIELTEEDLKKLIYKEIASRLNTDNLDIPRVSIKVKSKQNYKSEWESAIRLTLSASEEWRSTIKSYRHWNK